MSKAKAGRIYKRIDGKYFVVVVTPYVHFRYVFFLPSGGSPSSVEVGDNKLAGTDVDTGVDLDIALRAIVYYLDNNINI